MPTRTFVHRAAVTATALLAVAGGGTALAAGSVSANPTYQGCVTAQKTLTNVQVNPKTAITCPKGASRITWNQTGPAGATGSTGAAGAQGPAGPQGPAGTFTPTTVYQRGTLLEPGQDAEANVFCPAGEMATGGGGDWEQGVEIIDTVPLSDTDGTPADGQTPHGWAVYGYNTTTAPVELTAWVVCEG